MFALAHATGKIGRFTLIERWRNNERLLAPNDNPLKILMKWGEYSSDVQFILQKSESKTTTLANNNPQAAAPQASVTSPPSAAPVVPPGSTAARSTMVAVESAKLSKNVTMTMSPPTELFRQKKMMVDSNNLDTFVVEKEPKKTLLAELKDVNSMGVVKPAGFVLPHLKSPSHSAQSSIDSNNFSGRSMLFSCGIPPKLLV